MIDPDNILNFAATTAELEELVLFWVAAAGHNAHSTARALERFLGPRCRSPFAKLRRLPADELPRRLQSCGFGCYTQRARSFRWLAFSRLDLRTCTVEELVACPGIQWKTAKAFILYTRPGESHIIIDRHFLAYMREAGYRAVPKASPKAIKQYTYWELRGFDEARHLQLSPLEFDQRFWLARRRGLAIRQTA